MKRSCKSSLKCNQNRFKCHSIYFDSTADAIKNLLVHKIEFYGFNTLVDVLNDTGTFLVNVLANIVQIDMKNHVKSFNPLSPEGGYNYTSPSENLKSIDWGCVISS